MNVEYNQLDPLLRATIAPEGDVNDDTGFSPFPGEGVGVACRGWACQLLSGGWGAPCRVLSGVSGWQLGIRAALLGSSFQGYRRAVFSSAAQALLKCKR